MPIEGSFYNWNERARNVEERPGVYAFYDEGHDLIYIGESEDLRRRFREYLSNNFDENHCLRDTRFYKREFTNNHVEREGELLEEYEDENGSLPRCNTQHPS